MATRSRGNDRRGLDLIELAAAHGVATSYRDGERKIVEVDTDVVVRILGLLDVDAAEPEGWTAALARAREKAALGALPGTIGHRVGAIRPLPGPGVLINAEGTRIDVTELADDLEPGYYRLELVDEQLGRGVTVVVAPAALPETPRSWGWMLQLYALHSGASWGIGDLGDVASSRWGPEHGAGRCAEPPHALTPVPPVRRPLLAVEPPVRDAHALRVIDLDAYRTADDASRARWRARPDPVGDRIEHDRVWAVKRSASSRRSLGGGRPLDPCTGRLWQFAMFCTFAERYGPTGAGGRKGSAPQRRT